MLSFFHDLYQDFCLKFFLKELMFPNSLYKRLDFIILTYSLKIFFLFSSNLLFLFIFLWIFFYDLFFFLFFFFFWKFFSFLEICIRIFPLTCFFYSFFYEFFFYDLFFFLFFFFFWKFFSFLEICIRIFGDFKKVVFLNSIYQEIYFPFCILFFFCNWFF